MRGCSRSGTHSGTEDVFGATIIDVSATENSARGSEKTTCCSWFGNGFVNSYIKSGSSWTFTGTFTLLPEMVKVNPATLLQLGVHPLATVEISSGVARVAVCISLDRTASHDVLEVHDWARFSVNLSLSLSLSLSPHAHTLSHSAWLLI